MELTHSDATARVVGVALRAPYLVAWTPTPRLFRIGFLSELKRAGEPCGPSPTAWAATHLGWARGPPAVAWASGCLGRPADSSQPRCFRLRWSPAGPTRHMLYLRSIRQIMAVVGAGPAAGAEWTRRGTPVFVSAWLLPVRCGLVAATPAWVWGVWSCRLTSRRRRAAGPPRSKARSAPWQQDEPRGTGTAVGRAH